METTVLQARIICGGDWLDWPILIGEADGAVFVLCWVPEKFLEFTHKCGSLPLTVGMSGTCRLVRRLGTCDPGGVRACLGGMPREGHEASRALTGNGAQGQ